MDDEIIEKKDLSACATKNTHFWLRAIDLVEKDPYISDTSSKYFNVRGRKLKGYKNIEDVLRKEYKNLPRMSFLARNLCNIRRNALLSYKIKGDKSKNPFIQYALRWNERNNKLIPPNI